MLLVDILLYTCLLEFFVSCLSFCLFATGVIGNLSLMKYNDYVACEDDTPVS